LRQFADSREIIATGIIEPDNRVKKSVPALRLPQPIPALQQRRNKRKRFMRSEHLALKQFPNKTVFLTSTPLAIKLLTNSN